MTPQREAELLARIGQLTDRVIATETNRADAEDLRRENNELRAAMGLTAYVMIEKLREWTAESRYPYEPGAIQVAMPVSTACKIIEEIDQLHAEAAKANGVVQELCHESAERLRLMRETLAERDEARQIARGLRPYAERSAVAFSPGNDYARIIGVDALPDWLTANP